MAQPTNLIRAYDPNSVLSFKVGGVDIIKNRLYKKDASDLLVIAGDNEDVTLFYPLTAEKAGLPVAAVVFTAGCVLPVEASGTIAADAKVAVAANGMVKAATTGARVIGRSYHAVLVNEVTSVVAGAGVGIVLP